MGRLLFHVALELSPVDQIGATLTEVVPAVHYLYLVNEWR